MTAEADAHFARFGPFARVWLRDGAATAGPGHLPLLSLHDCDRSIANVRAALREPGADDAMRFMLAERSWRPNLVSAVAIALLPRDGLFADALWEALDAGSWVSPQLAVVLSTHDERFTDRALARLATGCATTPRSSGEAGASQPNAKAAAALDALVEPEGSPRTEALVSLLATDRDGGGRIALAWRDTLRRLLTQLP